MKSSGWRKSGITLFLPSVAETEILSFSRWTNEERRYTEDFLSENFTSIAFDRMLARKAGEIRARFSLKFPDAAIAASALVNGLPLVSRDIKDFKKIPNLTIVNI